MDNYSAYFGAQAVENGPFASESSEERSVDPVIATKAVEDYWGGAGKAPLAMEPAPPTEPWTQNAIDQATDLETAYDSPSGVDDTGSAQNPKIDTSGLAYPKHIPPNANEIGYGKYGAPAPFIPSYEQEMEQKIVIAVAEKIVAEHKPILVQDKAADFAHFETYQFAEAVITPERIQTKHPNGLGLLVIASATGLYMGEDQNVGRGNQGIPLPSGVAISVPVNMDIWVSSVGVELSGAVSLSVIVLSMGSTTL